ncbi:MAG: DUF1015 domain-containing protein [Eubacteriales bacterium]
MKNYLYPANIYLPRLDGESGTKWACVACDQYTSEREYWEAAKDYVGDAPSTLNLMLPEAYLDTEGEAIPKINAKMREYLDDGTLACHENSMIYLERVQSDGRVRRGIVGAVDLEEYDYNKGSVTLTRATEGTVLERIPPRVAIRRGAALEMPHIMILIDDPDCTVIEPVAAKAGKYEKAYDFDLMAKSGHVTGYFIDKNDFEGINCALASLCVDGAMEKKYGVDAPSLLFAIGDGNHSLASAKALYEEIKAEIGEKAAKAHPARFALCEIVNLHDDALEFEPIYRVVFGVDREAFVSDFEKYLSSLCGSAAKQSFELVFGVDGKVLTVDTPSAQLPVGTVQDFLDKYIKEHDGVSVDYIHGIDSTKVLAQKENAVGILFDGMGKDMLFKTVICDGALPRKTFSMGHAADKRFYIECRKIR